MKEIIKELTDKIYNAEFNNATRKDIEWYVKDLATKVQEASRKDMLKQLAKKIEDLEAFKDLHSAELRDCNEREKRVKDLESKIDFIMENTSNNFNPHIDETLKELYQCECIHTGDGTNTINCKIH